VGPFIAPARSWQLAGLGVGGAVGGLVGALVGMGIPEYEAKRYEGHVKDGGTLLSITLHLLAKAQERSLRRLEPGRKFKKT
jgi:hypothetical protein